MIFNATHKKNKFEDKFDFLRSLSSLVFLILWVLRDMGFNLWSTDIEKDLFVVVFSTKLY